MASDPTPPPLTTHEVPEGRHPASDPAVQAESPGPEPAQHADAEPLPPTPSDPVVARVLGGAVLFAFLAAVLTVAAMAAFSAADRQLWWGALVAVAAGIVVGGGWGAAGGRPPRERRTSA